MGLHSPVPCDCAIPACEKNECLRNHINSTELSLRSCRIPSFLTSFRHSRALTHTRSLITLVSWTACRTQFHFGFIPWRLLLCQMGCCISHDAAAEPQRTKHVEQEVFPCFSIYSPISCTVNSLFLSLFQSAEVRRARSAGCARNVDASHFTVSRCLWLHCVH